MPKWIPEKLYDGQDVYIIGGGKSLESFNWNLLKDKNVIGCNDAYKLDVTDICIFGDTKWYYKHAAHLELWKKLVITNHDQFARSACSWLHFMPRQMHGLAENAIGWNWSTGAAAINLAVLLGAKNIYLLGYDCCLINKQANWHPNEVDKNPDESVYNKFIEGFMDVKKDLDSKYPDINILNITNISKIPESVFPKKSIEEFFNIPSKIKTDIKTIRKKKGSSKNEKYKI